MALKFEPAAQTAMAQWVATGRYLIGADGAGSHVRGTCGLQMRGPVLQADVISVHFGADLRPYLWSRRAPVIWTFTPRGLGTIIVHSSPGDFVFQIPDFRRFSVSRISPPMIAAAGSEMRWETAIWPSRSTRCRAGR